MRKGVSPIIAATLLIAFTLTIALLAGPFFADIMQITQEGQTEEVRGLLTASQTSIAIENVVYDDASGNYTVTVRNNGEENITQLLTTVLGDDPVQEEQELESPFEPADVFTYRISTPEEQEENEIRVEIPDRPVSASLSLETVETGESPESPSSLDLSS